MLTIKKIKTKIKLPDKINANKIIKNAKIIDNIDSWFFMLFDKNVNIVHRSIK